MNEAPSPCTEALDRELPELDLSDEDILDAMRHIPGYLDISTTDFRALYHLAHHHAVDRLFASIRAEALMFTGFEPLSPDMDLTAAARSIVAQGHKGLPVADQAGRLLGMLTETDFLLRAKAASFLALMLTMLEQNGPFCADCHKTKVADIMISPAVSVRRAATFREIVAAFHAHGGRSMPVVEESGQICGLLLRKDFLSACHLELPA